MVTQQVQLRACELSGDGENEKRIEQRIKIAKGDYDLKFDYEYDDRSFFVRTRLNLPRIFIKRFKSEDYGSLEYAEACARELCDKLN